MTTNVPVIDAHPAVPELPKNYLNWSLERLHVVGQHARPQAHRPHVPGRRTGIAFLAGGLFALLVRLHLWEPTGCCSATRQYNQIFTLHGAFMVFLFVIPAIPGSIGNMVLPLMLGAKDVALPRLNLLSFYLWLSGAVLATLAIVLGGFDTGWTFYTPYSLYTRRRSSRSAWRSSCSASARSSRA
jgi:hypothetical protein